MSEHPLLLFPFPRWIENGPRNEQGVKRLQEERGSWTSELLFESHPESSGLLHCRVIEERLLFHDTGILGCLLPC